MFWVESEPAADSTAVALGFGRLPIRNISFLPRIGTGVLCVIANGSTSPSPSAMYQLYWWFRPSCSIVPLKRGNMADVSIAKFYFDYRSTISPERLLGRCSLPCNTTSTTATILLSYWWPGTSTLSSENDTDRSAIQVTTDGGKLHPEQQRSIVLPTNTRNTGRPNYSNFTKEPRGYRCVQQHVDEIIVRPLCPEGYAA